jgi:phage shock protein A
MSILDRIRRITRANVNDALDHMEDPEKMLKHKIRELEDATQTARQALANYAVSFKKMEKEQEQMKRLLAEWQQKAEASLKLGDEAMARKALAEKLKCTERIATLEPSIEQSRKTYGELKDNLAILQDQLRVAKLKASELQSRKHAAAAQQAFGASFDKVTASSVEDGDFAKMEDRVLQAESEVEIDREVRGDLSRTEAEVEKKSQELKVDAELEALKKSMGK